MDITKALEIINRSRETRETYLRIWRYVVNQNGNLPPSIGNMSSSIPDIRGSAFKEWLRSEDAYKESRKYENCLGYLTTDTDSPMAIRSYNEPFKTTRSTNGAVNSQYCGTQSLYQDCQIPIHPKLVEKLVSFHPISEPSESLDVLKYINISKQTRSLYLRVWAYIVSHDGILPQSKQDLQGISPPDITGRGFKQLLQRKDAYDYVCPYEGDDETSGFLTVDGDSCNCLNSYDVPFRAIECEIDNSMLDDEIDLYQDCQIPLSARLLALCVMFDPELFNGTADPVTPKQTAPLTQQTSEKMQMSTTISNRAKNALSTAATVNKDAALLATELAVGKAGLTLANKAVKPKVPLLVRSYVGSVYGDAVIANLVLLGVQAFAPTNAKANAVANAMVRNAAVMLMQEIDIEGLINSMFDGIEGGKVDELTAAFSAANGLAGLDANSDKIIVD